jgi:hypothetical protein
VDVDLGLRKVDMPSLKMPGLEDLTARARGELPDEVRTQVFMCHPDFLKEPHQEFLNGFTTKVSTRGHAKSLGLDIEFRIPASWKIEEGIREHIVQRLEASSAEDSKRPSY